MEATVPKVLIANRGEIAVRIADALRTLGWQSVAIHVAGDDIHIPAADESVELPGSGVAGYLDIDRIIAAARATGALALHPGYGFLSESPELAEACADAGITFIGPDPQTLRTFGNKETARRLAGELDIPVVPGTGLNPDPQTAEAFLAEHDTIMVKAVAGGGGRGIRQVSATDPAGSLHAAIESCRTEALHAFGQDDFFLERFVSHPHHIEVQVLGDGARVQHAWVRNCSVQRRNQKVVEIAPAPWLPPELEERILHAALALAQASGLRALATVEFLLNAQGSEEPQFFFMEVNPRLQVEHTVTEQITGLDLVAVQLRLGMGDSLSELGLDSPPARSGVAIQARINAETLQPDGTVAPTAGIVADPILPVGRYVRVDTALAPGSRVDPRFDSMIAKVIGTGPTLTAAARTTAHALGRLSTAPVHTNAALARAIVEDGAFLAGDFSTDYLQEHLGRLLEAAAAYEPAAAAPSDSPDAANSHTTDSLDAEAPAARVPEGATPIRAQMSGVFSRAHVEPGQSVPTGTVLFTLEAMKMEHPVAAGEPVTLAAVLAQPGDLVQAGDVLAYTLPAEASATATGDAGRPTPSAEESGHADGHATPSGTAPADWSPEVAEVHWRLEQAQLMGGEHKLRVQADTGRLNARERIDALADVDTFKEIGPLAGFGAYDDDGRPTAVKPSNYLSGTARIDGRKVLLGVDDFSIRGSSGDAAVHEKQIFTEHLAGELQLPVVRVLDGASGGGSVKKVLEAGAMYLPVNPGWDAVVDNLSRVPVVSIAAGPTVGLGAARFVMSHLGILVKGIGQIFTAGPPVVRAATGEDLTKEQLGGYDIHRDNGIVERFADSEAEAYRIAARFLSYLPQSVHELPQRGTPCEPGDTDVDYLLSAVPRNPRIPYEITSILERIFDAGSLMQYAEYGSGTYTGLARLDGYPVGVISGDPMRGATLSLEGAQAMQRLTDLCQTFHLPMISFTDQAGMSIGSQAERRATIRGGARAIAAAYQATIPQAEIVLRRVYGVGGAGVVNRHRAQRSWAWPSGDWGSLPPQGGIEAAFRAQLQASDDPAALLADLTRQLEHVSSPFRTVETFSVQDIIDPRTTRGLLVDWVEDAYRALPKQLGAPSFGVRP
jgi:acetyl/propionyl-CoA carboxylase alpha subunit/acetyl-CoA carboxylase carboxyltransferase component